MDAALSAASAAGLYSRKLEQAQGLLEAQELDAWLLVVRESTDRPDPSLSLLTDIKFTWNSYFFVTAQTSVALVATHDAADLRESGPFDEIRTYCEGPREALLTLLNELDPGRIGINYSAEDPLADGLTAGLRDQLIEALAGTPYVARLVSAAPFVASLRGIKLDEEQRRIQATVLETERVFDSVASRLRLGMTAREIAAAFHADLDAGGFETAWTRSACPMVSIGVHAPVGHASPGGERLTPRSVLHVDFGIRLDGYCSDLQRMWYVVDDADTVVPEAVHRAYDTVVSAIETASERLRPGTPGWEVDAAARAVLARRGFAEYPHALGHHLGRAVHDGGGTLGPRWERYGSTPYEPVEVGHVYTLEPSIQLEGHGLVSLEEDIVVRESGVTFLSRFPRTLPLLRLS